MAEKKSLLDKIRGWWSVEEVEDDESEENIDEDYEKESEEEVKKPVLTQKPSKPVIKPMEKVEPQETAPRPRMNLNHEKAEPKKPWFNSVEKWQTSGQTYRGANRSKTVLNVQAHVKMDISIETPENFDEARDLCARLQQKQPIVINLESIDIDMAQRLTDFLCGACYALKGKVQQIADKIYMLTPENVDFEADDDFRRTLENEGKINLDDK